jgi:adenylate kinase
MKIIFIGPQGSGKGTQAKIVSEELEIPHISSGEILRSAKGTLKKELDSYMNKGKLIPDELILSILRERINMPDSKNGFILDGFPRTIKQAEELDKITRIDKIVEIAISDEIAVKRLSGRVHCEECNAGYNLITSPKPKVKGKCDICGGKLVKRSDDKEVAVKKRLKIYHTETEPILKHYDSIKVNGEGKIEDIAEDILRRLR